jgi:hypothetical protein
MLKNQRRQGRMRVRRMDAGIPRSATRLIFRNGGCSVPSLHGRTLIDLECGRFGTAKLIVLASQKRSVQYNGGV